MSTKKSQVEQAPGDADSRELLTADEVAAHLRIARSSVYEWTRLGILPCVVFREGPSRSMRRWLRSDVTKFVEESRVGAHGRG